MNYAKSWQMEKMKNKMMWNVVYGEIDMFSFNKCGYVNWDKSVKWIWLLLIQSLCTFDLSLHKGMETAWIEANVLKLLFCSILVSKWNTNHYNEVYHWVAGFLSQQLLFRFIPKPNLSIIAFQIYFDLYTSKPNYIEM